MTREEKQKAIDALKISAPIMAVTQEEFKDYIQTLNKIMDWLEQEPKIGYWEWVQYDSNPNIGNWHCSECRTIIPHMPEETDNTPIYKWCPMCGAKMIEAQESEN